MREFFSLKLMSYIIICKKYIIFNTTLTFKKIEKNFAIFHFKPNAFLFKKQASSKINLKINE